MSREEREFRDRVWAVVGGFAIGFAAGFLMAFGLGL